MFADIDIVIKLAPRLHVIFSGGKPGSEPSAPPTTQREPGTERPSGDETVREFITHAQSTSLPRALDLGL